MKMYRSLLLYLLVCLLLAAAKAETWYFLPNYHHNIQGIETPFEGNGWFHESVPTVLEPLWSPGGGLDDAQRHELYWHRVTFPHRGFVELMPQERVFGWYACEFDIPAELDGLDVLADLGIIDDTDETFVNGNRVGGVGTLGQSHGTAWQEDRLYRLPSPLLGTHDNYLAAHVWSQWGLGGIAGPPVLKATPVPLDAQWEIAVFKDADAPPSGPDGAELLEEALSLFPEPVWKKAALPWRGYAAWEDDEHYAVFRLALDFPLQPPGEPPFTVPVVLDAGAVFDVAAFYLNGRLVGMSGRFPSDGMPAFTEAAQRARFLINPDAWSMDGHDELVAVVFRERGVGGLPGVPGLLLENPLNGRLASFGDISDCFDICIQSSMFDKAKNLLDKARPANDAEQARLLSHRIHLAYLNWRDGGRWDGQLLDGLLDAMAAILDNPSNRAPGQSAMQAFCHVLRLAENDEALLAKVHSRFPSFNVRGMLLPPDRRTRGDWSLKYGLFGWAFGAMGQIQDIISGTRHPLGGRLDVPGGRDRPCLWLPRRQFDLADRDAMSVPDGLEFHRAMSGIIPVPKAIERPEGLSAERGRVSSWWDDHGEMHPFDDDGPDLRLELNTGLIPKGFFDAVCVTVHHQDYDWRNTPHPRQHSVIVTDGDGRFLTAAWLGKTDRGVYLPFLLAGNEGKIVFRAVKHRSACVAMSGYFVDFQAAYPERPQGKPGFDLHPAALLDYLDGASRAAAELLLASAPGPERCQAGRDFLATESGQPGTLEGLLAKTVFLAIASDASFGFWPELDEYRECLRAMPPDTLERLLYHFSSFPVHPRWVYLASSDLFARIPQCGADQARRLLAGFALFANDNRLRELRTAALEAWQSLGLPEDDKQYERLLRTVPPSAGNGKKQDGD